MSFAVRDGKFDVVVVAGPRVDPWPSAGARAISAFCAEMGLSVGLLGGDTLTARGVIPLPGTGGIVLAEDPQRRIHRIHARALVRMVGRSQMPDPFPGWRSQGLIPLSSALRLRAETQVTWGPCTAILGTGNRALRFGSSLLELGVPEVYCIETHAQWGAKRFAGWEVERRRFEMLGGKLIEAKPVVLQPKAALLWEFKVEDARGIRMLEVARVVSAGPFAPTPDVREHPPGSFLFELEQTAGATRQEDIEGWILEEERGRWLGGKIIKALVSEMGPKREEFERVYRRARNRLKRYGHHREEPFTPEYQGKWMAGVDAKKLRESPGMPREAHKTRPVAALECIENIGCNLCEKACPSSAIRISRNKGEFLFEADCTSCGLCVSACPSGSALMLQERESFPTSLVTLPWRGTKPWTQGEFAALLNRRGESLGSARVVSVSEADSQAGAKQLVQLEVPTHLAWEARAIRRPRAKEKVDQVEAFVTSWVNDRFTDAKVEITLNGEKRLVRDGLQVGAALFEIGQGRAGDVLYCPDGSCGLCELMVDGVKKLACQTKIHRGMAIRIPAAEELSAQDLLCPCAGATRTQVIERIHQGKLRSAEAVQSITHVGEGRCHGQLCGSGFRRLLEEQGLDSSQWIDWRFPWSDWVVAPGPHE